MKKRAIYQRKRAGASPWFNKWVQSPRWFFGFWIAVAVCLAVYAVNALVGTVHPRSMWGLTYGILATVVLAGVLLYALRRRAMRFRPGRTWHYLQLHVYGGALFMLLVLMHVGFRVPQGVLTWWLWAACLWVTGSGFLGIVLQKWVPTLLNSGLTTEVNYDRIPELVGTLNERAERLVATSDVQVREYYQAHVAPALAVPKTRWIYYLDITGGSQAHTKQFDYLRTLLPVGEKQKLDDLERMYRTKLEIDAHYTLQKSLRWWLYLHVPVSLILLALLGLHIFSVLYY